MLGAYFFSNVTKYPNVTGLVTERVKCEGASQRLRVQDSPEKCENNRSFFSAFGGCTWAGFTVKTDEPPRAGLTELAGRILPTPDVDA